MASALPRGMLPQSSRLLPKSELQSHTFAAATTLHAFSSTAFRTELSARAFTHTNTHIAAAMPSASTTAPPISIEDLDSFATHLKASTRILALLGAGISASSGLPTFRGAGGYWRSYDAISLASPGAFNRDPGLVWQFYSHRRHMALRAQPNRAHLALAALARAKPDFLTLSQNVDGLSPRAHHPPDRLLLLHGSLFDVKCTSILCDYVEHGNVADPLVPALAHPLAADGEAEVDLSNPTVPMRDIPIAELPHCPACKTGLLRPGVVWFGEALPLAIVKHVEAWIADPRRIDIMLVIGTSAQVHPAAGYIMEARRKGARIAVVNTDPPDSEFSRLEEGDWFFQGDAGTVVPLILEAVIGRVEMPEERL